MREDKPIIAEVQWNRSTNLHYDMSAIGYRFTSPLPLILALILSLLTFKLSWAYSQKTLKLTYDKEGVHLEYLMYLSPEGSLYCKDLTNTWNDNPLWIWNYVDNFWAEAGQFGILTVYLSFDDIRWAIIHPTKGYKIWGGYLLKQSWQYGKLKNVTFELRERGGYVTLTLLDEALGEIKHLKYWIDIWGRHELIEGQL